jgi:hypothetical protein
MSKTASKKSNVRKRLATKLRKMSFKTKGNHKWHPESLVGMMERSIMHHAKNFRRVMNAAKK